MREVSKSDLQENLVGYLQRVEDTGEEIVITDHGRPVVKLVAVHPAVRARISPPTPSAMFGVAWCTTATSLRADRRITVAP